MSTKTPEEVLKSIAADFKLRGVTHETAAQKMGYGSKQTLSNLLSSKKYMSGYQAKKFHEAFGYNMEYLMRGDGELMSLREADDYYAAEVTTEDDLDVELNDKPTDGDIQLMLSWIHALLEKQNNEEGLMILAEIYRYSQAKNVVRQMMKGYQGDRYNETFNCHVDYLQSELMLNVESLLNRLTVRKKKEDSK